MDRAESQRNGLLRNLKDAGCSQRTIERFLKSFSLNQILEQKSILAAQRKKLLDNVHKAQQRLDCLDYLLFQLNKTHWTNR